MKKSIDLACKIMISLVTVLSIIFFASYFIKYFKSGGYAYDYRILILISTICLVLFSIGSIAKNLMESDKKTKIFLIIILAFNIIVSGIVIYYYLDAPKKYIKKVNLANVVFIINYLITFIYILVEDILLKIKSSEQNMIKAINPACFSVIILMTLFLFLVITSDPKSYNLNLVLTFIVFISSVNIFKYWGINLKIVPLIFVILSAIIHFGSGIGFSKHFATFESYQLSTFINAIAIILMMIGISCSIDSKKHIIALILEIVMLIVSIVIFNAIRLDNAGRLDEMKDINIYRIISIFLIYIYIIKDQIENIISKNIISIVFSGITLVLGIIFMILTINKMNELYYIFFKQIEIYAIIALVLLLIGTIYLIVNKKLADKKKVAIEG